MEHANNVLVLEIFNLVDTLFFHRL